MPANLFEDRIPQDLIRCDGWLCWKSQPRNGKFTKAPINPHTDSFNLNRSARSTNQLHRPVIDKTGLSGTFDIHLTYAGTNPLSASPAAEIEPSLSAATISMPCKHKLGWRLESSRVRPRLWLLIPSKSPLKTSGLSAHGSGTPSATSQP
jgi:uncharacterized protein DUF3738